MRNRLCALLLAALLVVPLLLAPLGTPADAQVEAHGWTTTNLNLRRGPGTTYTILALLPAEQGLLFEARSGDSTWLLAHTTDGALRGWITSQYVRFRAGYMIADLAISAEIIGQTDSLPVAVPPPGEVAVWTNYQLHLRTGPGTTYAMLGTLAASAALVPEARSADSSWLLVHMPDGAQRGWVAVLYLRYPAGFAAAALPVSVETLTPAASPAVDTASAPVSDSAAAATLMSVPVLPATTGRARAIFQGSGNDPHVFLKVGDCNSEYWEFLGPLDSGEYNLGAYSRLQPTVDFFGGSWGGWAITAHGGFNVLAVLDPMWVGFHDKCEPNETPLACELRTRRPAVAVMMFGPNDVVHLSAELYESTLRQIVTQTIDNGTIPVLTTFTWCQTGEQEEKGLLFNLITVNVAREYNIPLINFWRAAQALPYCGLMDRTHLSKPAEGTTGYFDEAGLQYGHTLRNLLTLQTLDALRIYALQ